MRFFGFSDHLWVIQVLFVQDNLNVVLKIDLCKTHLFLLHMLI